MSSYARIQDGAVMEVYSPPDGMALAACFAPGLVWVPVPADTAVQTGDTYADGAFALLEPAFVLPLSGGAA